MATPSSSFAGVGSRALELRIQKLLELRTDTPALLDSLTAISEAIEAKQQPLTSDFTAPDLPSPRQGQGPQDTDAVRKSLRSAVEWHSLQIAEDFIKQVAPLQASFSELQRNIQSLQEKTTAAANRIAESETSTAAFTSQAQDLLKQREAVNKELTEVRRFLAEYEVSANDAAVLQAGPSMHDGGAAFFNALRLAAAARKRALELITGPKHALGLELLDAASRHGSLGLDLLFTWIQQSCRDIPNLLQLSASHAAGDRDRDQTLPMLQQALFILRVARPALFRASQEALVSALKNYSVRKFLRALTGGPSASLDSDDTARPIDASAHDPLRYLGDMCAWVHYHVAETHELLEVSFFQQPPNASTLQADFASEDSPTEEVLSEKDMLASITEGVARPLSVRIDQIVGAQAAIASTLRVQDTLAFYLSVLEKLLTSTAPLSQAFRTCLEHSSEKLRAVLDAQRERYKSARQTFPGDLSTTSLVQTACKELEEVCMVHQNLLAREATEGLPAVSLCAAMDAVLTPLVENCRKTTEGLRLTETAVFMLNNIGSLIAVLRLHPQANEWVQRLSAELVTWEDTLVENTANDLLQACNLLSKLSMMKTASSTAPLATVHGLAPTDIIPTIQGFYTLLASPTLTSMHDKVLDSTLRNRLRDRTMAVLAAAYRHFYEILSLPQNQYMPGIGPHLTRTPDQIDVLLRIHA